MAAFGRVAVWLVVGQIVLLGATASNNTTGFHETLKPEIVLPCDPASYKVQTNDAFSSGVVRELQLCEPISSWQLTLHDQPASILAHGDWNKTNEEDQNYTVEVLPSEKFFSSDDDGGDNSGNTTKVMVVMRNDAPEEGLDLVLCSLTEKTYLYSYVVCPASVFKDEGDLSDAIECTAFATPGLAYTPWDPKQFDLQCTSCGINSTMTCELDVGVQEFEYVYESGNESTCYGPLGPSVEQECSRKIDIKKLESRVILVKVKFPETGQEALKYVFASLPTLKLSESCMDFSKYSTSVVRNHVWLKQTCTCYIEKEPTIPGEVQWFKDGKRIGETVGSGWRQKSTIDILFSEKVKPNYTCVADGWIFKNKPGGFEEPSIRLKLPDAIHTVYYHRASCKTKIELGRLSFCSCFPVQRYQKDYKAVWLTEFGLPAEGQSRTTHRGSKLAVFALKGHSRMFQCVRQDVHGIIYRDIKATYFSVSPILNQMFEESKRVGDTIRTTMYVSLILVIVYSFIVMGLGKKVRTFRRRFASALKQKYRPLVGT